jgi:hypothetical protein
MNRSENRTTTGDAMWITHGIRDGNKINAIQGTKHSGVMAPHHS